MASKQNAVVKLASGEAAKRARLAISWIVPHLNGTLWATAKPNMEEAEWRRAWLRRELPGLVVRDTGEVAMQGLRNLTEGKQKALWWGGGKQRALEKLDIEVVLDTVDGHSWCWLLWLRVVVVWTGRGHRTVGG